MLIQTDMGIVDTETGIIKQEWESNEWFDDREVVDTSKSYDINVTFMSYNSKFKNIFLLHDKENHRIFSREYYKKHRKRILAEKKILYDKDPKKWIDISKDYYYNKGGNTKMTCKDCGRTHTKYGIHQHKRTKYHNKKVEENKNKLLKKNQTENLFRNLDIDKIINNN